MGASEGLAWLTDKKNKENKQNTVALRVKGVSSHPEEGRVCFFAPDFALRQKRPWLIGEPILNFQPPLAQRLPTVRQRTPSLQSQFLCLHKDILLRIGAGQFEKVVPMVTEEIDFMATLSAAMFPQAFVPGTNEFAYGFEFDGQGLLGVTPEVLFDVSDGVLRTMALAGTGMVGGASLMDNAKERHEHQLVIEHIATAVKIFGSVEIGPTSERVYRHLKHLHTPIEVRLLGRPTFSELISCLHPTAALGGWPRTAAMDWMEQQDFHLSRRRFGAPFGYQVGERMYCVVAIRGLQWSGSRAWLAAGCGVVARSQAHSEWEELQLKLASTRAALGISL